MTHNLTYKILMNKMTNKYKKIISTTKDMWYCNYCAKKWWCCCGWTATESKNIEHCVCCLEHFRVVKQFKLDQKSKRQHINETFEMLLNETKSRIKQEQPKKRQTSKNKE